MTTEATPDFCEIEKGLAARGLAARGFVGIKGIDSMAKCHKDEKHWILRTDGLIIYTTYPWTHDEPPSKKDFKQYWGMEEFTFASLDEVISIVNL